MTLAEVSRRMMVSNGNITGLATRLETEGLITRHASATDRRSQLLRLTARGRREFARQSAAHEDWIVGLFEAMPQAERQALFALLGRFKSALRVALNEEQAP